MKIVITSVLVDDQDKALAFYTDVLGFVKKTEFPAGEHRWLTVVSPEAPDGPSWLLEPDDHPKAAEYKDALVTTASRARRSASTMSRPSTSAECARGALHPGAADEGPMTTAVLDDTCGNLIQIASQA